MAGTGILRSCAAEEWLCWRDAGAISSQRPSMAAHVRDVLPRDRRHGNVCPRCALGSSAMARCSRNALLSVRQWQYVDAMHPLAPGDGDISTLCVSQRPTVAIISLHASQKRLRTEKAPLPGNISPPCIQNELALARYARHVSEKPRKPPFGNAWRADLTREGPFSLH